MRNYRLPFPGLMVLTFCAANWIFNKLAVAAMARREVDPSVLLSVWSWNTEDPSRVVDTSTTFDSIPHGSVQLLTQNQSRTPDLCVGPDCFRPLFEYAFVCLVICVAAAVVLLFMEKGDVRGGATEDDVVENEKTR